MISVKCDVSAVISAVQDIARDIPQAIEAGLDDSADFMLTGKNREQGNTYKRPIPKSKTGRPKWTRKGDNGGWLGEQQIVRRRGHRTITTTGAPARYEGRLARLPKSKDGVNRRNPAADTAYKKYGRQAVVRFEAAFRRRAGI